MGKYLNKDVKFQCDSGNGVFFVPINVDIKTKIDGSSVLTENCSLKKLVMAGQCNKSIQTPPFCMLFATTGLKWNNSSEVKISGQKILAEGCSIRCPIFQGVIKHERLSTDVQSGASYKSVKISLPGTDIGQKSTLASQSVSGAELKTHSLQEQAYERELEQEQEKEKEEIYEHAVCNYKDCDKASSCEYLKTSYKLNKEDSSKKNAAILKANIARDFYDFYCGECEKIRSNFCLVNHHHIIPAKQCFKPFLELVKLANFYGYDINNALNGICLPSMGKGYDKQDFNVKCEIAFDAMQKLGKQWHKGHHEFEKFSAIANNLLSSRADPKDYKTAVDDYLIKFFNGNKSRWGDCPANNYEAKAKDFCERMNAVSKSIAGKLRKFETEPKKSAPFFVSKLAYYFAYYNELKQHEDILFKEELMRN